MYGTANTAFVKPFSLLSNLIMLTVKYRFPRFFVLVSHYSVNGPIGITEFLLDRKQQVLFWEMHTARLRLVTRICYSSRFCSGSPNIHVQ